jgi:drug/metabolite transporter (DMT)-like permease
MSERAGHLAALGAIVLWGLSFVATKVALGEIAPTTLVFTRFALGSAFLFVLLALRRRGMRLREGEPGRLFLLGGAGVFLHQMLQSFGLVWTTATRTGWLIGLIPIWSAVLAALFLSERLRGRRIAGLLLGVAGALAIVGEGGDGGLRANRGDWLILASTVNWAACTVYGRAALRQGGGLRATAYVTLFGTALLALPFLVGGGWVEWPTLTATGWAAVAFLGVGCSGVAYLGWFVALERLDASRVAAYLYLEPLVTQAAAMLLLAEPPSARVIAGGLLVLAGVFLVQR